MTRPIKSFMTSSAIIVPAITTEQMIEVDRIAMEETGPNLFQMMENAGRNLALHAIQMLGTHWQRAIIVILAGSGGNGGGGICAARHLANRNSNVQLGLSSPNRLGEVPKYQYHIFRQTSGKTIALEQLSSLTPDLIIDALIGYSLKGAPRGKVLDLVNWANNSGAEILSLDIPSGVDSSSGESPGSYIKATATMTLALPKQGLLPQKTGELWLADIGIPAAVYQQMRIDYESPFEDKFRVKLEMTNEE